MRAAAVLLVGALAACASGAAPEPARRGALPHVEGRTRC
jgi:hypothetical protein